MAERLVRIKGTKLSYQSHSNVEHLLEGSIVAGAFDGILKHKDIYIHYMGDDGVQRRLLGTLTGEALASGRFKNKGDNLYFGDRANLERVLGVGVTRYYPETGTAATGHVYTLYPTYSGVVWAVIYGRATADRAFVGIMQPRINSDVDGDNNEWNIIGRGIAQFDTTELAGVVSAARLGFWVGGSHNQFATTLYLNIYEAVPEYPDHLELGDYNCFGTTPFSTGKSIASMPEFPPGGWIEFELNASGIAVINAGGITAFGLRIDLIQPGWGYNLDAIVGIEGADTPDPAERPYLEVEVA